MLFFVLGHRVIIAAGQEDFDKSSTPRDSLGLSHFCFAVDVGDGSGGGFGEGLSGKPPYGQEEMHARYPLIPLITDESPPFTLTLGDVRTHKRVDVPVTELKEFCQSLRSGSSHDLRYWMRKSKAQWQRRDPNSSTM
jgi:hypothetical protein